MKKTWCEREIYEFILGDLLYIRDIAGVALTTMGFQPSFGLMAKMILETGRIEFGRVTHFYCPDVRFSDSIEQFGNCMARFLAGICSVRYL